MQRRLHALPGLSALLSGIAVLLALAVVLPALSTPATVRVELEASSGDLITLFINDVVGPPQSQALLTPGVPHVYEFPHTGSDIDFLRVDIEGGTGVALKVHGLSVMRGDDEVVRYGPAELETWDRHMLVPFSGPTSGDVLALEATGGDPFFGAAVAADVTSGVPDDVAALAAAVSEPNRLYFVALMTSLLLLAATARSRLARRSLLVASAAWVACVVAFALGLKLPGPLASPEAAVGGATYFGRSIAVNNRAVLLGLAAALVTVGVSLWLTRRAVQQAARPASRVAPTRAGSRPPERRWRWVEAVAVLGAVVGILAVIVPDLRPLAQGLRESSIGRGSNFDAENGLAWIAFADRGLVPMRDFWYPYGNMALFDRDVLLGPVASAAVLALILAGYAWVLWCFSAGRPVPTALGTFTVLLAQPSIVEFRRYGLALIVALTYAAMEHDRAPSRLRGRVVFAVMTTLALFIEPVLVVYAAAGVVFLVLVDIVRSGRTGWVESGRRVLLDLVGPALGGVLWLVVSAAAGQLGAFFEFYTTLQDDAAYGAMPTDFGGLRNLAFGLQGSVVWVPALMLAMGVWLRTASRSQPAFCAYGGVLIAIGGVMTPLAQKHAIRPLAPYQALPFLAVAVILLLVIVLVNHRARAWHGGAVGALLAACAAMPFLPMLPDLARDLPGRVVADVDLVGQRLTSGFGSDRDYSPSRFTALSDEQGVVSLVQDRLEPGGDGLFVLGDESSLYVMLNQRPPWQVNVYNTSPIAEQQHVLRLLRDEDPEVVVLTRRYMDFDGVPHQVRVPLLFEYVVSGYSLEARVGDLDVLSTTPTVPPEQYWPEVLGTTLDLGLIPANHSYDELEPCAEGSPGCAPFLRLRPSGAGRNDEVPVEAGIDFGGVRIVLSMRSDGDGDLVVPLSRTWPYGLSEDVVLRGVTTGWEGEIVYGHQPEDVLY